MYTNLRKLRESLKMTQKEFGASVNVSKTTYSNYELGIREPNSDFWIAIADKYDVTVDYLLDRCDDPHAHFSTDNRHMSFSQADENLVKKYRKLDTHGKEMVDVVIEKESARMSAENIDTIEPHLTIEARRRRQHHLMHSMGAELERIARVLEDIKSGDKMQDAPNRNVIKLQCPGDTVAAAEGPGTHLDSTTCEVVKVFLNDHTRKADMLLRVRGRSMEPEFFDGDRVLVRSQPDIMDGEIGVFTIDGEGFLKQKAADRLVSLNPGVPDIYVNELQDCRCVGKVIGKLDPDWIVEE